MTSLSLFRSSRVAWDQVCSKGNKAVVFIDSPAAESLHWIGGAMMLYNAGAVDIKELSSFESAPSHQKKALFIVSSPLEGMTTDIIRHILQASSFQYVIVVSTLNPVMHTLIKFGGIDDGLKAFHDLEDKLLEWMGNMSYTAEVTHFPIATAPISPQLFVLPTHSKLFPLLPTDIETVRKLHTTGKPKDTKTDVKMNIDFTHLPQKLQLQLKLLVCAMDSLLEQLGVAEDCYALGQTSQIVAAELASLPWAKPRRKTAQHKASVLFVDRSLDVASALSHNTETLMDRIIGLLPHLPGHTNDIQVNMAPVCSVHSDCDPAVLVPGCLAHPGDNNTTALLHSILTSKLKEALMEVNRSIVEAASKENLPLKLSGRPGRVTADQLQSHIALFKAEFCMVFVQENVAWDCGRFVHSRNLKVIPAFALIEITRQQEILGKKTAVKNHSGVLQVAQAAVDTLKHPNSTKVDSLLGVEKGLLQTLGDDDSPGALLQIVQTLQKDLDKPQTERIHSVDEILQLLLYVYSLVGDECSDSPQQEKILQASLVQALETENENNFSPGLREMIGSKRNPEKLSGILNEMLYKINGMGTARQGLKQFGTVYNPGTITSPASTQPLLKLVVEAIFNPNKPELVDIEYKSTGFRDLLKSGFGLFLNVSKPRPNDYPLLIIFVLGGVTSTEVRQIKEAVAAAKVKTQVVVGTTSLVTPSDMVERILCQENLYPEPS